MRVSSAAENKEISVCLSFKQHTRPNILGSVVHSITYSDKDKDIIPEKLQYFFSQIFILVSKSVGQPSYFQTGRGRTGENTDFQRIIYLEISAVAPS